MNHRYEVIIYWSENDGVYLAEVPELPGCMAHGDSAETALAQVQQAIALWIEVARSEGRQVPEAKGRKLMYA